MRAGQSALVDGRVGRARWRAWVVSPRRGSPNESKRRLYSRACHGPAGDRAVTSQCPINSTVPSLGKSVGGVSERAGAKAGGSNPFATDIPSRDVAVKGILVVWKAALFAGRRRNDGLGRSIDGSGYPPATDGAPMTADVRRTPRRGTSSAFAIKRMHPAQAREIVACAQGTRPSLGPSTRARQSSLCSVSASFGGGAFESASRSGKPAQAGGTGTGAVTDGRSAARRVPPLPQGRERDTSRKGRRSRPPSLRGLKSSGLVARTS